MTNSDHNAIMEQMDAQRVGRLPPQAIERPAPEHRKARGDDPDQAEKQRPRSSCPSPYPPENARDGTITYVHPNAVHQGKAE